LEDSLQLILASRYLIDKLKGTNMSEVKLGKGYNPKSLENLKRITPETARANQLKSVVAKQANIAAREQFKLNAKNFIQVMDELPKLSPLDVMRMAIHKAIAEDNYEDAARYAALLAEYEAPKLARIEQTNTNRTVDLTDEELQDIINKEGL
jgi:hypothetical protein